MRSCAADDAGNAEVNDCNSRPKLNPHRLILPFGRRSSSAKLGLLHEATRARCRFRQACLSFKMYESPSRPPHMGIGFAAGESIFEKIACKCEMDHSLLLGTSQWCAVARASAVGPRPPSWATR